MEKKEEEKTAFIDQRAVAAGKKVKLRRAGRFAPHVKIA